MITRRQRGVRAGFPALLVLCALTLSAPSGARPLTAVSTEDPLEVCLDYLRSRRDAMGFAEGDLEDLAVTDRYQTRATGMTHLYLRQRIDGVPVHGAEMTLAVDAQGRLVSLADRLERRLAGRVATRLASLSPEDAARAAAAHLGLTPDAPLRARAGPAGAFVLPPSGISRDEIPLERVYVVHDGAARLAWNLVIRTPDGRHQWNLYVDATDGRVLRQNDWIARDSYRVHAPPLASPSEGPRTLEVNPADATASPFGWHDTDGVTGAEFTDTRGNNVFAQEDADADDAGGLRPDGGPLLDFDFSIDLTHQPGNYIDASIANLFYWNNLMHDVLYQYGFDEPAGNFQSNNYGRGGSGGDPVQADTQDGSDVDNAQFGTPPDGQDPRMEMFRWIVGASPRVIVSSPPAIAGTASAGFAFFGAGTPGLSGTIVQALDPVDGAGPTTTDACSPLTNPGAIAGNIAIVDRGSCFFVDKVGHAQDAGAIGAIVVNNAGEALVNMSGVDPSIVIPAVFIGQSDGLLIESQLGFGVSAQLSSPAQLDSSLDSGVVAHEYGHGVSNRLTGGPANVNCLFALESRGMGEGWSDFLALVFTAMPGDVATDTRGLAPYLIGQPPDGGGIRNFPYSTDLVVSPLTYADVSFLNWPHGVGEVWAASLWELYWKLVDRDGFDPDLYAGSGGNNLALQLVIDTMKLQPCSPTFVSGRDALLAADTALTGGANECLIWESFAKRGLGLNADDGGSASTLAVTEDFDLPMQCLPEPGTASMLVSGWGLLLALERRRRRAGRRTSAPR